MMRYVGGHLTRPGFVCSVSGMLFGAVLLAATAPSASADDLQSVYLAAKANDPQFRIAQREYEAAQQQAKQLRAGALPSANLELQKIDTDQTVISSDNTVFQQGSASYGTDDLTLRLTQPIFRWDRVVGWKQSRIQEKQAEAKLALAGQELQVRVAEAYFNALSAREAVILSRAQLASATRQFEDADARYKRGLARRTDQLDAQARMAQVEAQMLSNQNAWEDALQALRELTGTAPASISPVLRDLVLAPPDPVSAEQWVRSAIEGNVELQAQQLALDVATREVERLRAGHYPTLDLSLTHTEHTTDGSLFGGGSQTENDDLTLALNVPLYAGGAVAAKRREGVARREQAREEYERLHRAVERQTRAAYQGILSSIRRSEALSQSVKAQELAVETKKKGFATGLYTSMTVLDAEEDLFADRQEYAQARYDYLVNWIKLRRAAGQLKESDITALNRQLASDVVAAPVPPVVAPQSLPAPVAESAPVAAEPAEATPAVAVPAVEAPVVEVPAAEAPAAEIQTTDMPTGVEAPTAP